jgi:hypothetical protein
MTLDEAISVIYDVFKETVDHWESEKARTQRYEAWDIVMEKLRGETA